jgi:probable rRNA maturation factor
MITLEISEGYQSLVDSHPLEEAAKAALRQQSAPAEADLTIVITDDEQLQELNHQYRDINAPTDVLSFPADFTDPENELPYLGDILISYERAAAQAAAGGHAAIAELQLLVVHGVLHLLGHDHADPPEKAHMWAAQNEILRRLGLENIQIAGDE